MGNVFQDLCWNHMSVKQNI